MDLWQKRMDARFKDRAPRLVQREDEDAFECEGRRLIRNLSMIATAGVSSGSLRPKGRYDQEAVRGGWDPHRRVKDTAVDGVEAEVLYPSLTMRLYSLTDPEFQAACFSAYNDWLAEFCAAYPDRLKGAGVISLLDVERGVEELQRVRRLGLVTAVISVSPDEDHQYHDPRYDPFWAAAQDLDMPLGLHALTEQNPKNLGKSIAGYTTEDVTVRQTLAHMVGAGIFERFPRLKVVSVESDVGWLPYFLERLDYICDRRNHILNLRLSGETPPSDFVRRQAYFTFMRDSTWVPLRHHINVDHVMWASDYPHMDSVWPRSREMVARIFHTLPEEETRKVVAENAARLYGFA
ncbi:MAG: amidohydrolase [Chloroflexi bacterium]|nr:amidohydrolase [Chloroflexota bacterium]